MAGGAKQQEEQVGVAGAGYGAAQDDLVPAPDDVAQRRHRGGERRTAARRGESGCGRARAYEEAGDGGGGGGRAQPEVAHDQRRVPPSPSRARSRRRMPRTPGPAPPAGPGRAAAGERAAGQQRRRELTVPPVGAHRVPLVAGRAEGASAGRASRLECGARAACDRWPAVVTVPWPRLRGACEGRRRRLRRVGSLVHWPCIARRPPHSLTCPSPAPSGAWRSPCRDDTPVSSLRDIAPLLSVTTSGVYTSTHRIRRTAEGAATRLRRTLARRKDHVPQRLPVQRTGATGPASSRLARGRNAEVGPPTCGLMSTPGACHSGWPGGQRFGVGDVEGGA